MFGKESRSWLAGGASAVALVTLLTLGTVSGTPGSQGLNDSYFPTYGNGGYDVSNYAIDVNYAPSSKILTGTTTITATTTQALSRFDLDFVLKVTAVKVNGVAATFTQKQVGSAYGKELIVTPKTSVAKNAAMTVLVTYSDKPLSVKVNGGTAWTATPTGAIAEGEAESAAWWFPSNDYPTDKATYDISITVPSALKGLSNGKLVNTTTSGALSTWKWRVNQPMATYLAFMAVGDYTVTQSTLSSGVPYLSAVEVGTSATLALGAADMARTPEVLAWLESKYGPYPFDAAGNVLVNKDYGDCCALENQTRPTYPNSYWAAGSHVRIVVHEQTHQWFGDSVSVSDWSDIWLNEGPAYFTEWLWDEDHGVQTVQSEFDDYYTSKGANSTFWKLEIADPGADKLFNDPIYVRGAMTLQALRNRVGDANFFTIMSTWAAQHKYGNGTTTQFWNLAASISGQNLDGFFQHWIIDKKKPANTAENGIPQ